MTMRILTTVAAEIRFGSAVKRRNHLPLGSPFRRQRVPLEPQQTHAPRLLPGQDGLNDGRFQ